MSRALHITVLKVGARSPLGLNALQVAMALRARQFEPRTAPFTLAEDKTVGVGFCRCLSDSVRGLRRYATLGAPALREALAGARHSVRMPLFLALPEAERPGSGALESDALLDALAKAAAPHTVDVRASEVLREGHAGFAFALTRAIRALNHGAKEVLVGGIDSPFDQDVLRWMDERDVLLTDDRAKGRIPTEAAAFVRLALRAAPKSGPRPMTIAGVETVQDAARGGASLGRLLRRVAASPKSGDIDWVLSDVNGEPARSDAWLEAAEVASSSLGDAYHHELVQHTGDMGAATGAMLMAAAKRLAETGSVAYHSLALALSSDGQARGVVAVDLPGQKPAFSASMRGASDHVVVRRRKLPAGLTPGELLQMERMARSCVEDIGSMGLLLAPDSPAPDGDKTLFVHRMMGNLDALASLGHPEPGAMAHPDVLRLVQQYGAELESPDRSRQFAVAFVMKHVASRRR